MGYHKILIAVDSSSFSYAAAREGFDLARQLSAEVALVFVVNKARVIHNADSGILPEEAMKLLHREAENTLHEVASWHLDVKTFMPEAIPSEGIIQTAEDWGADLIVMGTHGRTGLKHLLLGSVAEHVIRHSKIPSLIVPSHR